ncbi:MAG: GNAT family N-acetyltransferase [Pseudomonadota bacterium]
MNRLICPGQAIKTLRSTIAHCTPWTRATQDEITPLLRCYMDELSGYGAKADGDYPFLSTFWRHPTRLALGLGRHPLQGFVLLVEDQDPGDGRTTIEVREFYVSPTYRRAGIGRHAVHRLLAQWQGDWQLSVLKNNVSALEFWQSVLSERSVSIHVTATHHHLSVGGRQAR